MFHLKCLFFSLKLACSLEFIILWLIFLKEKRAIEKGQTVLILLYFLFPEVNCYFQEHFPRRVMNHSGLRRRGALVAFFVP